MNCSIRRTLSATAVVVSLIAVAHGIAAPRFLGSDFEDDNLLEINPQTGASTVIGHLSHSYVASLAFNSQSRVLYATTTSTSLLLTVNPDNGATTLIGSLGVSCCMHGLAYNSNDDTLYGTRGNQLYRINPSTGVATLIASMAVPGSTDLAFDSVANVMYLSEINGQHLYTVNLTNGALTLIGSFNAPGMPIPQVGVGMAFDPVLGLFATDNTGVHFNNNPLYRINTTNGQATLVGLISATNVLGLAFLPEAPPVPGDMNCDGAVNVLDVGPFALALIDANGYLAQFPTCDSLRADMNGDHVIDGRDLRYFVERLLS